MDISTVALHVETESANLLNKSLEMHVCRKVNTNALKASGFMTQDCWQLYC